MEYSRLQDAIHENDESFTLKRALLIQSLKNGFAHLDTWSEEVTDLPRSPIGQSLALL